MIYDIINSEDLLERISGINNWIEENKINIGNANMYEIMSCMIARNNLKVLGVDTSDIDSEIERMISLRSDSINEFQSDVPESKALFDAVHGGLTVESRKEIEFICKCQSVPFFINNTRCRGFDGDITMSVEDQSSRAIPTFKHDNYNEVIGMSSSYDTASDEIKSVAYPVVNWIVNNSVDDLRNKITIAPIVNTDSFSK